MVRNASAAAPVAEDEEGFGLSTLWDQELGRSLAEIEAWEPEPEVRVENSLVFVSNPVADVVEVRRARNGDLVTVIDGSGAPSGRIDSLHALSVSDSLVAVGDGSEVVVYGARGRERARQPLSGRLLNMYGIDEGRLVVRTFASGVRWIVYAPGRDSTVSGTRQLGAGSVTRKQARADGCWMRDGVAGGLLSASCTYPIILEVGLDGGVRREISVDLPAVKSSNEELQAVRNQVSRQLEQAGRDPTDEVRRALEEREVRRHTLKKRFRAVREDPASGRFALLEQTPDYMGGGTAAVHLFGSDGRYLSRRSFDAHWIDFDFASGRLYALRVRRDSASAVLVAYGTQGLGR